MYRCLCAQIPHFLSALQARKVLPVNALAGKKRSLADDGHERTRKQSSKNIVDIGPSFLLDINSAAITSTGLCVCLDADLPCKLAHPKFGRQPAIAGHRLVGIKVIEENELAETRLRRARCTPSAVDKVPTFESRVNMAENTSQTISARKAESGFILR